MVKKYFNAGLKKTKFGVRRVPEGKGLKRTFIARFNTPCSILTSEKKGKKIARLELKQDLLNVQPPVAECEHPLAQVGNSGG